MSARLYLWIGFVSQRPVLKPCGDTLKATNSILVYRLYLLKNNYEELQKIQIVALTIDKTDCYTRRVMMCVVTSSTCVCFGVANFSFTMSTQLKAAE